MPAAFGSPRISPPARWRRRTIGFVKLLRVAAAAEDNSTYIHLFQDAIGYSTAPLHAYDFDDGLTVIGAAPPLGQLVGGKVERIGGRPLEEVRQAVGMTISATSDGIRRYIFGRRAFSPELLHALGLSASRQTLDVLVRRTNGATVGVTLKGSRAPKWTSFMARSGRRVPDSFEKKHFWVRALPKSKAVVAEIRAVRDEPDGMTLSSFAQTLATTLARNPEHRLVLDLRYGGGGSGHAMGPIVDAVAQSPQARSPGRLFGLIGRLTSGTVLELTSVLRNHSPLVLVGEPAAAGPNGVGDPQRVVLPKSKVVASVTKIEWPTTLAEEGEAPLAPDVLVPNLAVDYLSGRDRALEVALASTETTIAGPYTPAQDGARWAGVYSIGAGQYVRIAPEGGRLWLTLEDASALVGRSFVGARTPLFVGADGGLLTLLKDVSVSRTDGQLTLQWRSHTRSMTPTFWSVERMALAAVLGGAVIVLGLIMLVRRRK